MAQQLKWQLGTVVEIRQETPTVKSLVLELPGWTTHLAGQHVDVRLTAEDGYQAQRSYSISSSPEDGHVSITVEAVANGEVSPYLTEVLSVGDQLEPRGPIGGYFVWSAAASNDNTPLLLVAGGSGIAPLMAMLRHRAASATMVPTRLIYSSRGFDEIIFRDELERLSMADRSLEIFHTLTRQQPDGWAGYSRRIDREMLSEIVWSPEKKPLAYACGPTALVESVATHLQNLGYEPGNIKTERFGPTGV
ncbi:MAG TPA: ferredoxin reductase [Pyrinomonadaceae bacterium]|nr:ferredoxin reductase [Pyrinomonadaceae bacterium]